MAEQQNSSERSIELNERAQHLLKALVERYISDRQRIGSRTLSRDSGLDLSPATVRNVMADLEELGFLTSPHTSAGRIPTARGYRLFVDSLLLGTLDKHAIEQALQPQIDPDKNLNELMQSVSSMLSEFTQLAGVVMMPRHNVSTLRHVEFLPLSEQRVLAILVINGQEVQNRIIHTQRDYSQAELQQAANFLNEQFCGRATVIEMADKTFKTDDNQSATSDFIVEGQTNLMGVAELSNLEKLRQLFEAFNRKRDILHLLDQCMGAQGVQIFIGEESGYDVLDECSVVTAPYEVNGQILGVLGVIGPTRMAYGRVIPIVDVTAKLLASALNSR